MVTAKDAFGKELQVGDTVVYYSYESFAKAKIIGIEIKEEYKWYSGKPKETPMIMVEKIAGAGYRPQDGLSQVGKLTRLDRVAKI